MDVQGARLVGEGLAFPEGPVALADGTVLVVELLAGRLSRITPAGTELVAEPGGGPNGAAIGPDGAVYVCNNGGLRNGGGARFERVDLATGAVERIVAQVGDHPLRAPNDLVFDRAGGDWFTDV
ncbi:MAG: SMP-30/gluconolactonase/LRE family protein, partial [Acidimicrobiales bacterium]